MVRSFAIVLLAGSSAAAEPRWSEACTKLKQSLGEAADAMFTWRLLAPPPELPTWRFAIGELSFALPRDRYDVLPRVDADSRLSLILVGRVYVVAILRDPREPPMRDIFQKAGEAPTAVGEAATKKMFGGPPSLLEITRLGYRHRPSELTCRDEDRDREMPIAVALALKVGPIVEEVYDDLDGLGDLTFVVSAGPKRRRETRVETARHAYAVSVSAAASARLPPLLLSRCPAGPCTVDGPPWLAPLAEAAASPGDAGRWMAVDRALENPSEKSHAAVHLLAHPAR